MANEGLEHSAATFAHKLLDSVRLACAHARVRALAFLLGYGVTSVSCVYTLRLALFTNEERTSTSHVTLR